MKDGLKENLYIRRLAEKIKQLVSCIQNQTSYYKKNGKSIKEKDLKVLVGVYSKLKIFSDVLPSCRLGLAVKGYNLIATNCLDANFQREDTIFDAIHDPASGKSAEMYELLLGEEQIKELNQGNIPEGIKKLIQKGQEKFGYDSMLIYSVTVQ